MQTVEITKIENHIKYNHFKENYFVQKRTLHNQSPVELVCNTCKREMDSEMCRIVITRNIDGQPQFFSYHFFSPCWNIEDFCQKYPNLILDRVGISILENHSISENGIKDLQTNSSYWIDSKYE